MSSPIHYCKDCVAGGDDWQESGALHAVWHALLERRIEEAGHYKPPPTYR